MIVDNNSTMIKFESWFIPIDILMIVSTMIATLLAFTFLAIIIMSRTCRTVPLMLVGNSCLAAIIFECTMLSMALFTLQNDIKQNVFQDLLCIFRGYMGYVTCFLQNYSYALQAIYRYISVVYPARVSWQSARFQASLIGIKWIFSIVYPLPLLLTGEIIYNVDNQICQVQLRLSPIMIYTTLCIYMIPITIIMLVYFKLFRYVHEMSKHVTPTNTLFHARRELEMVRRIVFLVIILIILGLPYMIFILMSFVTIPPKYHFRIAYLFVDISSVFVMIALFQFTEPIKTILLKMISVLSSTVNPTNN
ncbi:unnamed protein product [Rotaria sp. Silwood1]|nr:unnamed protein product [Rotaria sp. Silwood1]CAF1508987.1 unnamed protein product [Rotaria sp. Silwood1]CAF3655441.1 unnamed protein product [Rotaria sp. Silwood1]CAF3669419.1 unnamed protein product [Rotaria sp. Silwood1]CAF3703666.1 unnamed protein product [Rotaria sp. Silwood1]